MTAVRVEGDVFGIDLGRLVIKGSIERDDDDIPRFYRCTNLVPRCYGRIQDPRLCTCTSPEKAWARWRREDEAIGEAARACREVQSRGQRYAGLIKQHARNAWTGRPRDR